MSKAKLIFNLDEHYERLEFIRATKATSAYLALHAVANEIFRPNRKHGYGGELDRLIDATPSTKDSDGDECPTGYVIIDRLEKMFYEILEYNNINLHEELD